MSPPIRPPPCRVRPCRWSSAWVDSHTVRKHSTCRQRPEATASIALTIEPDCPGVSGAPTDPRRAQPQGVLHRGGPALRVAGGPAAAARIGRETVDVFAAEAGVVDRAHAGLDSKRQRVAHEPATELGHPDPRDGDLVFELVGRRHRPRAPLGLRLRRAAGRARDRRWARTAGTTRRPAARTPPPPSCRSAPHRARTRPRSWSAGHDRLPRARPSR